jgi:hypothetical protein
MGRVLALTGIVLTVFYAVFIWWLVGDRLQSLQAMELNGVGDFLAGVFGPLAILWLVLGFFQQGIELRQGTAALLLQADELRSSVDQQKESLEVSRDQFAMQKANTALEHERLAASVEPKFSLSGRFTGQGGHGIDFDITIVNAGQTITCVEVGYDSKTVFKMDMLGGREKTSFTKNFPANVLVTSGWLVIGYLNGLEELKFRRFNIAYEFAEHNRSWEVVVTPKNGEPVQA